MPRGGEYDDGPTVQSDNAIESTENKIAGGPKADSNVSYLSITSPHSQPHYLKLIIKPLQDPSSFDVDRSNKAAPLPAGISEMKDGNFSGGGSQGYHPGGGEKTTGGGSGKGGKDEPAVDRVTEESRGGS